MKISIPKGRPDLTSKMLGLMDLFPGYREEIKSVFINGMSQSGVAIDIKASKRMHSREQENYYWKWCRAFAEFCGYTPDQMHEVILMKCFGTDYTVGRMGPVIVPRKRSSSAKSGEYSQLIETLIREAAELDFIVPPPDLRNI